VDDEIAEKGGRPPLLGKALAMHLALIVIEKYITLVA